MKRSVALVACLSLSLVACEKTKSEPPTKPAPTATASDPAAPPGSPAPVTKAPTVDPTAVPAGGIKFPAHVHVAGEKVTETDEQTMAMKAEVGPSQTVDVGSNERRVEVKETLDVDRGMIAKLKITYQAFAANETMNGKSKDKPTPTAGKTYLVWREGDQLKASYEDGSAPPADELKEVVKGNRGVGRPEPLEEIMASHTFKLGERFELSPDQLAKMNEQLAGGGDNEPSITGMSFTLQSADATVATLAMTMAMAVKGQGNELTFTLAGSAKVDRTTGRPLEISAIGPFSGFAKVKMTGTMSMKNAYAY